MERNIMSKQEIEQWKEQFYILRDIVKEWCDDTNIGYVMDDLWLNNIGNIQFDFKICLSSLIYNQSKNEWDILFTDNPTPELKNTSENIDRIIMMITERFPSIEIINLKVEKVCNCNDFSIQSLRIEITDINDVLV